MPRRKLAFAFAPARCSQHLLNTFRVAVAGHAKPVDGDAWCRKLVAKTQFRGVNLQVDGQHVQHGFECEAYVHRAVAAHCSARWLIGEHTIAVVAHVANVVERTEQLAGIEHRHRAISAERSAVLYNMHLYGLNLTVTAGADFKGNQLHRAPAMPEKHLFPTVSDPHRNAGLGREHRRDHFQRTNLALGAETSAERRLDHTN